MTKFAIALTQAGRILNAVIGGAGLAASLCVAFAAWFPVGRDVRFALAYLVFLPLWVGLMTILFLASRPVRTGVGWIAAVVAIFLVLRTVPH